MARSLTGDEIKKIVPWDVPIYRYPELDKYEDIDKLLGHNGCCVILFETIRNEHSSIGHWTALIRTLTDDRDPSINFFDSYGIKPDLQKNKIDSKFMEMIDMTNNYLTNLLYNADKYTNDVIEYNEKHFQQLIPNINTCGRHCVLRIILKDLSMNEYQKFIDNLRNQFKKPVDEIVTILTDPVLNNEITPMAFVNMLHELFESCNL